MFQVRTRNIWTWRAYCYFFHQEHCRNSHLNYGVFGCLLEGRGKPFHAIFLCSNYNRQRRSVSNVPNLITNRVGICLVSRNASASFSRICRVLCSICRGKRVCYLHIFVSMRTAQQFVASHLFSNSWRDSIGNKFNFVPSSAQKRRPWIMYISDSTEILPEGEYPFRLNPVAGDWRKKSVWCILKHSFLCGRRQYNSLISVLNSEVTGATSGMQRTRKGKLVAKE